MFINQILTKLKSLVYSKSETDSLLNGKASSSHTHTKSQITDFPTIPSKTSQLTNDSGFITGISWANVSGKPSTFAPSSHIHTTMEGTYSGNGGKQGPGYYGKNRVGFLMSNETVNSDSHYKNWLYMDNYSADDVGGATAIGVDRTEARAFIMQSDAKRTSWNNSAELATRAWVTSQGFITSAGLLPIGSYIQFAGSQAPAGFLVCNGGAVSRTTYSKLFAVIGTKYGSGNGSTTFNLPNLTDRVLQGSTTSGTVKNAGLPNITGYFGHTHAGSFSGCFKKRSSSSDPYIGHVAYNGEFFYVDFAASKSSSIYGNSSTVQPPALTCLICIKY